MWFDDVWWVALGPSHAGAPWPSRWSQPHTQHWRRPRTCHSLEDPQPKGPWQTELQLLRNRSLWSWDIRRPRPEPWPGRRLGPPLVWTSSAAKLKAVASQVFLSLANPRASNASNLSKPAKRALGAASIEAVASQVVPFLVPNCCCQTSGCGKPSLSVSTGPKLPDAPSKSCKRPQTLRNVPKLPN